MGEIKFKFSKPEQRRVNVGGSINPIEDNIRRMGRHFRHFRVNLTKLDLRKIRYPDGIEYATYPLKDEHGNIIPRMDPRYFKIKPINMSLFCSENRPFVLARWTAWELDNIITNLFGKYIVREYITEKEEAGIKDLLLTHTGILEESDSTENHHAVKNAFNVRAVPLYESEIEERNKKLEIMGYKIRKNNAIAKTEKTINHPVKYYFEGAEF